MLPVPWDSWVVELNAELVGAPKTLTGCWLAAPKPDPVVEPPNSPVPVVAAPKGALLAPPNKPPEVLAAGAPKPPNPVEAPAVVVLPPNIPPLLVAVLAPKAGLLAPKALLAVFVVPKPVPIEELSLGDYPA